MSQTPNPRARRYRIPVGGAEGIGAGTPQDLAEAGDAQAGGAKAGDAPPPADAPAQAPPPTPAEPTPAAARTPAEGAAPPPRAPEPPVEDGFGPDPFPTAAAARPRPADPPPADPPPEALRAIEAEGLSPQRLRLARRIAQKRGIAAASDIEAVYRLREAGIDPFSRSSVLGLVAEKARDAAKDAGRVAGKALARIDTAGRELEGKPPEGPPPVHTPQSGALEILEIQRDILRRRRRRLIALAVRLVVFVVLPTILMAYYYTAVATPLYASKSEFVIQQADAPSARGGSLLQTSPMATAQDAMTVQGYLMSRGAMLRLDADAGFAAAFSAPGIDPILRLAPDAGIEEMFRTYSRQVRIGFDPTEGIVKLEVRAPDPMLATAWSQALLGYAEERVDTLSQRLRTDQMAGAEESLAEAEAKLFAARERLIGLQERFRTMSGRDEIEIVNTKISTLERELTDDRLGLQQILSNPSPNAARVAALGQRIDRLEAEIEALRARLIDADDVGLSLARIQGEMMIAEAELDTRQEMLREAMQAREQARIEANRQVRYLSVSVNPLPADEAAYPRVFENTAIAFLIFLGIYLMLALTVAVLREQVSS